jgi:hypothetical protein
MTEASVPASGAPREVLAGLSELTRRVRTAQRGTWFPLLLLGLLVAGTIVVDRLTFSVHRIACPAGSAAGVKDAAGYCGGIVKQGSAWFWLPGLALVYVATAVFYVRRARSRGVGSVVRPYVVAGIVVALLIAPTRFWSGGPTAPGAAVDFLGLHFHATSGTVAVLNRITGRAVSVGVPLLLLAWIERNRALLVFVLGYLVIELVPITVGPDTPHPAVPWSGVHGLAIPAAFLLLGALGFWWAERRTPEPEAA